MNILDALIRGGADAVDCSWGNPEEESNKEEDDNGQSRTGVDRV